jgi:hypothetical protein
MIAFSSIYVTGINSALIVVVTDLISDDTSWLIVAIEDALCRLASILCLAKITNFCTFWTVSFIELIDDNARLGNLIAVCSFALFIEFSLHGPSDAINIVFALFSRTIVIGVDTFSSLEITLVGGANRAIITRISRTVANDVSTLIFRAGSGFYITRVSWSASFFTFVTSNARVASRRSSNTDS